MAQAISFVGKERKEQTNFITEGGLYRHKIVKHEIDGYTQEGNEKHKYTFESNKIIKDADGKAALSKELYSISSTYNVDEKQEWVFMNLVDAIGVQTAFDPADLVGRYVMCDVDMKAGRQDPSKFFANMNAYGYRYSKANDGMPPVKELVVEAQQQTQSYETPAQQMPTNPPVIDIDEDEIPF